VSRAILIAILSAATLFDGQPSVAGRIVANDTGEAIVNARVLIVVAGHRAAFAITDGDGRFSVTPPANPFTVIVLKSGFIRRAVTVRNTQGSLELRLARAAVISGRVVDRTGEPIVDARVAAESAARAGGQPSIPAVTSTNDVGEFRLSGLGAESFIVAVTTMSVAGQRETEPGLVHYDSQLTKTYYPESNTANAAEVIRLAAGEEHPNVDIVVPATQIGGVRFAFTLGVGQNVTSPPLEASGAIAGRVVTRDGRPLAHAVMRLIGAFAPAPDQATTTDADGRYAFEGLAAGTYRIAASKSGYAPLNASDIVLPQLAMLGAGPSITLREDQKRENVDVTLARLGSVSGFVVDELGDPIQGATIQVLRVRFERGRRRLVPSGTARMTDDLGHYRIFDLGPGTYLVAASVGTLMTIGDHQTDLPGYAQTYFPGSPDPRSAQFVAVSTSQDVVAIDFALAPSKTTLVSGTIVNAAGEPTTAGTLQLRQLVGAAASPVPMNAKTSDGGAFEFANVPPGSYVIYADRGRKNPSTEGEFMMQPVTVTGDDITGLKLQMSSGSSIAGRVTFDTTDPDHRPDASRVDISPIPVDADVSPGTPANADIARDWTFQMSGINGVRRLLAPRLPPGWALREVRVNGVDATDRAISFGRLEQSLADVEVVLTDRVATIVGAVTDGDQRPIAGVPVLAFTIDRDRRYPWSRFVHHTMSAADGTFKFDAVPGGSYYLAAVGALPIDGDDAWQDAAFLDSLTPTASTVTVNDGEKRTIALRIKAR
jgi:protocatechuate 3,4-dioxygenase beta subunit